MSASSAWQLAPVPAESLTPESAPLPGRHLRLVPTGADVGRRRGAGSRLTRRGRLTLSLLIAAALAAAAVALSASAALSLRIDHVTSVRGGQTLSEVAAQQLPGLPTDHGIVQIQVANHLDSLQVHAGQVLAIPSTP